MGHRTQVEIDIIAQYGMAERQRLRLLLSEDVLDGLWREHFRDWCPVCGLSRIVPGQVICSECLEVAINWHNEYRACDQLPEFDPELSFHEQEDAHDDMVREYAKRFADEDEEDDLAGSVIPLGLREEAFWAAVDERVRQIIRQEALRIDAQMMGDPPPGEYRTKVIGVEVLVTDREGSTKWMPLEEAMSDPSIPGGFARNIRFITEAVGDQE